MATLSTSVQAVPEVAQSPDLGRFHTVGVTTVSAGHGIHDTYTAFLAPLLPTFVQTMSLTRAEAGLLTVFMQEASLLQPLIGGLADRFSVRYFVILAPAITGIAMSMLGVVSSYWVMAMLLTFAGISSACLHAVGPVMAGQLSGKSLGRGMGFWMVGGEVGRTIGPLIIVGAVSLLTLEGTPWLMLGGIVASILLYVTLRNAVPVQAADARDHQPWREAMRTMRPLLLPLTGVVLMQSLSSVALQTYLPMFLQDEGSNLWLAGASLSILQGAGVVGAFLGGTLSDRLGRRRMLLLAFVPTSIFMLIFLATSGWVRFPLLLILGFTSLSIMPVLMAIVQESVPESRALANGVYMGLNFVVRSILVVIVGALGDYSGLHLAFTICAVLPLVGLPILLALPEGPVQRERVAQ